MAVESRAMTRMQVKQWKMTLDEYLMIPISPNPPLPSQKWILTTWDRVFCNVLS